MVTDKLAQATAERHRALSRSICAGFTKPWRIVVFYRCWIAALLCCFPLASATLSVFSPAYGSCGDVSINGVVLPSAGDTITKLTWSWGDGSQNDSSFPGTHEYSKNGTFTVLVTASSQAGQTISTSETVTVTSAGDALCAYDVRIIPGTIVLRDGVTSERVQVSLRDSSGILVPLGSSDVEFTSSAPSLVQVDATGTVSSTGFGSATITAKMPKYPRSATAQVVAGHFRIEPAILLLSTAGKGTGQLTIDAYNADGTPFDLSSASVAWNGTNGVAAVDSHGLVTALQLPTTSVGPPAISAQVNGINSHNGSLIRVLSDPNPVPVDRIATPASPQTVFYIADSVAGSKQPQMFADYDAARVTDLAYRIERFGSGVYPSSGDIQYLANDVSHDEATRPCGYNGNPVVLGSNLDTGASCLIEPPANGPAWGIYFHEIGHNFTLSSRRFSDFAGALSTPTYVEGLATGMAMFAGRNLLSFSASYGLSQKTITTLQSSHLIWWHPGSTPSLDAYVAAGTAYQTMTADVLGDIIMALMDENGYAFFRRFLSVFLPVDVPYPFQIQTQSQQATFFVAALSAAIRADLRSRFWTQWGFPVDDSFYASIYPRLVQYASHADTAPPFDTIIPTSTVIAASGATGSVTVVAPGACPWTGSSNASWVTVTSGTAGCGVGTLTYSAAVNSSGTQRTATLTVAGQVFSITQSGSNSPLLGISKTHSGNFTAGQPGATYTVTVSNSSAAAPTSGAVTVTEMVPTGLTLVSLAGAGWNCSDTRCTRADVLDPGKNYPPITVTVNVMPNAPSQVINQVGVTGGGSTGVSASDTTNIQPLVGSQISGVFNAATSLAGGIAPNEFISIWGGGLGPDTGGYSGPMTTLAAGTRIYIGGTAAPITYSSATQVNALVPFGVAGTGTTTIQAEYNGVKGNTVTVSVMESSPGIFTQGFGPGQAWVVNQDQTFNSASNPAPRSTYITFWATGQGLVDIPQQDGKLPTGPPFPKPLLPVSVSLGGVKIPDGNVVFTGLVYSSEIQVNVLIPDSAPTGDAVPLGLTIGSASSRTGVTMAIK